jgi:integrase
MKNMKLPLATWFSSAQIANLERQTDTTALRTARISVNAILRRARSLFSPRKLRHLPLTLARPLPFEGIEFAARQSMKYRSEIDVEKLIAQARHELEHNDPEAYKAFLLAVGLGLRRKEIDLLEWPSFGFDCGETQ